MPSGSQSGDASGADSVTRTFLSSKVVLANVVPVSAQQAPGSASPVMRIWEPLDSSTVLPSFTSFTVISTEPSGIGGSGFAVVGCGCGTRPELPPAHPAESRETARVAMVSCGGLMC